ncbi:MAG: peptidoglycan editing factor PgeF [Bacteroidota bacterium]
MSTRNGGVSPEPFGMNLSFRVGDEVENVERNRMLFLGALEIPPGQLASPMQCHSAVIKRVMTPGTYEDCDALMTDVPGLYLLILVADCVPVLLYDPASRAVAAVHAGWKGSAEGITAETVGQMRREFHSSPERLVGFIGASAGPCCYEVGREVALRFDPDVREEREGRTFLNLKLENRKQLLKAGFKEGNIETEESCTICSPGTYHSYRREGKRSGRMMGIIGLKEQV